MMSFILSDGDWNNNNVIVSYTVVFGGNLHDSPDPGTVPSATQSLPVRSTTTTTTTTTTPGPKRVTKGRLTNKDGGGRMDVLDETRARRFPRS